MRQPAGRVRRPLRLTLRTATSVGTPRSTTTGSNARSATAATDSTASSPPSTEERRPGAWPGARSSSSGSAEAASLRGQPLPKIAWPGSAASSRGKDGRSTTPARSYPWYRFTFGRGIGAPGHEHVVEVNGSSDLEDQPNLTLVPVEEVAEQVEVAVADESVEAELVPAAKAAEPDDVPVAEVYVPSPRPTSQSPRSTSQSRIDVPVQAPSPVRPSRRDLRPRSPRTYSS